MILNLGTLNVRWLSDPSKYVHLLGELSNLSVDVAAVQGTLFTCAVDCGVLEDDYFVLSVYGSCSSASVSLLIGRSLNADVKLVLADVEGRLVVADVTVKIFEFRVGAVYAPNIAAERVSFFRRLALFLDDPKWIALVGNWNATLDPKIDRVRRKARRSGRCKSSLLDFMACHDLVDRFRQDHPEMEMWTWLDNSHSVRVRSYLERVLVRKADTDFVTCPTFHYVAQTDHRLVKVSVQLANRPSLAGYWKFNTFLLEIQDFRDRLESQFNLDRTKVAKSL